MEQNSVGNNNNCILSGVSYGSPLVLPPLVGVACGGKSCYKDYASVWSDVAIDNGNRPIPSPEKCQALCHFYQNCDVWTYWSIEEKCELFASAVSMTHDGGLTYDYPVLTFHNDTTIMTSPRHCASTVWLPFLQLTTPQNTFHNTFNSDCWRSHSFSYGVAKDGACQDAEMIAIYAADSILELGMTQQWWNKDSGLILIDIDNDDSIIHVVSPDMCQQACDATPDCGGWQVLNQEVCILKTKLDCNPIIAARANFLAHRSAASTAGVQGCINGDADVVATEEQSLHNSNNDDTNISCQNNEQEARPQCTKPLYQKGYWSKDTFYSGENCLYKQYSNMELRQECFQKRWMVITGASNVLSFFVQLIQKFTKIEPQGPLDPFVNVGLTFAYSLIDVVFDEVGEIIYVNTKQFCEIDSSLQCGGSLVFQAGTMDWSSGYPAALETAFAQAPSSGMTRITMVMGHVWSHIARTLESVFASSDDDYWNKVMFYGQAMIWYPCFLEKWCKDPTMGSTNEQVLDKFESDMQDLMQAGGQICSRWNFDCFFASHGYGSATIGPRAQAMISILQRYTSQNKEWAHYIDYNVILRSSSLSNDNDIILQQGVVDGHLLPAIIIISQTMIWNTICPTTTQMVCPETIQMTPVCWANCQERGGTKTECNDCMPQDWMCMSSRQCNYEISYDPSSSLESTFVSNDDNDDEEEDCLDSESEGIRFTHYTRNDIVQNSDTCMDNNNVNRIWCGTKMGGWIISCVMFAIGLGVTLYGDYLWEFLVVRYCYTLCVKTRKLYNNDDDQNARDDDSNDEKLKNHDNEDGDNNIVQDYDDNDDKYDENWSESSSFEVDDDSVDYDVDNDVNTDYKHAIDEIDDSDCVQDLWRDI